MKEKKNSTKYNNLNASASQVAETVVAYNAVPQNKEFTISAPVEMSFIYDVMPHTEAAFERDALALYPYIIKGQISNGRAAKILGISRWNLIKWYGEQGLQSQAFTVENAEKDFETIKSLFATKKVEQA